VNRVPKPTRRNPFSQGSMQARVFDNVLKSYAEGHRDIIREDRTVRCMGNSVACAFWRGYDAVLPLTIPEGTPVWAAYRAGQAQRIADDEQGAFIPPPKTNSRVLL